MFVSSCCCYAQALFFALAKTGVLEGLHVYRARLNGKPAPVQIVADINRTG